MVYLKKRLADPKLDKSKIREYLLRLLYVELLGHDASFGHIHAVKLCSDASLVNKKVAYLTTCLFLSEESELLILLMNTMKSDLHSDNYLIVCASLDTVCHLATEDAVPLILPSIRELVTHPKELVRKKAVMALHRFYLKAPHLLDNYGALCRKVLCDHDPSVMGAALCALYEAIKRDALPFKNLVKSLLHVLTQIVDRRLPKTYDNHRAPAPFLQIKILKMLALLGQGDKASSSQMHPVILACLKSANSGTGIGNALVYECVRTAIAIHPDAQLLTASAAMVAHFLNSSHAGVAATAANNLKYVALDALGGIVQIDPSYGEKHQLSVIDCLEDPDETLKKKTLELLYRMTTTENVEIVVDKMLTFLEQTSDEHIRADVATRVSEIAEQYAPDNQWFIETMNKVFELAGDLVRPELADDLMQLIAEGTGESPDVDTELRRSAVESYIDLLGATKSKMPKLLLAIVAWVGKINVTHRIHPTRTDSDSPLSRLVSSRAESTLVRRDTQVVGEYGTLCMGAGEVMDFLVQMGRRQDCSDEVRAFILTALTKVCCSANGAAQPTQEASDFVSKLLVSKCLDLQQRAVEFKSMMTCAADVKASALPTDASCEELDVDSLAALDAYVSQALANGAAPYIDLELRDDSALAASVGNASAGDALRYEAYEPAAAATESSAATATASAEIFNMGKIEPLETLMSASTSAHQTSHQPHPQDPSRPTLNISGPRKWGRPAQPPPQATQAPPPVQAEAAAYYPEEAQVLEPEVYREPAVMANTAQEPAELTEKERLAASLFGGGGGNRRRGAGGRRRGPSSQAPPQQSYQQPRPQQQQQQQPNLLLDMDPQPQQQQQQQQQPMSVMDELSLLDVSAPAQPVQPQPQQAPNLLGGMGMGGPMGMGSAPPMGGVAPMPGGAVRPGGNPPPQQSKPPANADPFKDLLG